MKTQAVTIAARQFDPVLDSIINEKNLELNELARKKGQHFAKRNQPHPIGDNLEHYTPDIKASHEKLGATIFHHLQPEAHFPEATWDADHFKEKDSALDKEIQKKECQKHNHEHELGNYDPKIVFSRIRLALILTGIIMLGDTLFNTKAFQVIGDTLLFALIIAICVSVAVFIFSHAVPFHYKKANTVPKKRLIVISTLLIVTALFTALGIFRSQYLASHDVHISPVYFVIINLFFFIVSTLVSFYMLPTMADIKLNGQQMKLYRIIQALEAEITQLKNDKEELKKIALENKKQRARIIYNANYALDIVRKMFNESRGHFMSENLIYRTDGKVPDCFSDEIPELDINEITIVTAKNIKPNE